MPTDEEVEKALARARPMTDEERDRSASLWKMVEGLPAELVHIGSIHLDNAEAARSAGTIEALFGWVSRGFLGADGHTVTISVIAHKRKD